MKLVTLSLILLFFCFLSTQPAVAQTISDPTPTLSENTLTDNSTSSNNPLSSFFSSFDWISSGLVFNTPTLLDNTIKLSDGTELSGMSEYRNIFYDIATPLFVIAISLIAVSHITHDNTAQLKNFFKRLLIVIGLFIITPSILSYGIQFVNLLNNKITEQNSISLISFITDYIKSADFSSLYVSFISPITLFFSPNTIMQMLIFIVAFGFLLIGFLYIIFQAIIRFIALLFLSVLFPIILPFALSEKTENITNTYFRVWFTFLIQQPAFVLGFAIVTSIFTSILKAHGGNMGTLFLFSGSLIFLGGVNVFVGKIFGDSWSLLSSNAQSFLASNPINKFNINTAKEIKRGAISGRQTGVRTYIGSYIGKKIGLAPEVNKNGGERNKKPVSKFSSPYTYSQKPL